MTYCKHKKSAFADSKKGSTSLAIAIIFGLFFLSVIYLAQANSVVAKNFELRSAQSSLKAKQDVNQQLMIALTQARSLESLASAAKERNLVAVEKVDYLKLVPEFFAFSQKP